MSYLIGGGNQKINTESTNGTFYIMFEDDSGSGIAVPRTDSGLTYNPSTEVLETAILQSSVATGTSPLIITSTTLVANLNVQYLNGQASSYYAPINSPTFTGTPSAPTAGAGTNTTQLATTQFVQSALAGIGAVAVVTSITQPPSPTTGDVWIDLD